jgi:hypothetical protein
VVMGAGLARASRESHEKGVRVSGGAVAPTPAGHSRFVTMVKPEAMAPGSAEAALGETLAVLEAEDVQVHRWAVEPAARFLARGMLARHYPRLHRVAREGASALCDEARGRLAAFCESHGLDEQDTMTPYDAFVVDADLDAASLDTMLRDAGVTKLGPGSYVSQVALGGRHRALLNGFVPMMAEQHLERVAGLAVVECTSEREIADLRDNVLGTLDPGAAAPSTLRARVAEVVAERQGGTISEGRNGIHLSAGHLEGVFQVWHYLGAPLGEAVDTRALAPGMEHPADHRRFSALAADPNLLVEGSSSISPFGVTEGLPLEETADLVAGWLRTPVRMAS